MSGVSGQSGQRPYYRPAVYHKGNILHSEPVRCDTSGVEMTHLKVVLCYGIANIIIVYKPPKVEF